MSLVPTQDLTPVLAAEPVTLASAIAAGAADFAVATPEDAQVCSDQMKALRAGIKHLEDERAKATKPINEALARIRGWFAPHIATMETGLTVLRTKYGAWDMAQKRAAEEARRAAEERARAAAAAAAIESVSDGETEAPPPAVVNAAPVPSVTHGIGSSTHMRSVPRCALVDPAQVPRDWIMLNETVAKAAFKAAITRGEVKAPADGERVAWRGCEFWNDVTAVTR